MRGAAFTNRHKVRGWKTQIRRVERWRQAHLTPDWAHFERSDFDYCKIQLDPWNRLVRRQPPMWLARRMLHGLLDIHEAWAAQVPDAPYLRIWLNWPHVMDSQVVVAGETRANWYQDMFTPVDAPKRFPAQVGEPLLGRLSAYDWQECLDEYPLEPQDAPPEWLSRRPHRTDTLQDGSALHWVTRGRVWVGVWIGTRRAA